LSALPGASGFRGAEPHYVTTKIQTSVRGFSRHIHATVTAATSVLWQGKGPNMVANTFSPQFPLKHQQKDVNLACDLGKEVGVALPMYGNLKHHSSFYFRVLLFFSSMLPHMPTHAPCGIPYL